MAWFLILEAPLTIFRDPDGRQSNLNTLVKSSLLRLWQGQGLKLLPIPSLWRGGLLVEHQQLLTVLDLHHHFLNPARGLRLANNLNPSLSAPFQADVLSYQNLFTH